VGGFAVQSENWRWSFWELLWFSGPTLLIILISLPETSSDAILLRRAKRLRGLTGRFDLKPASESRQAEMSPGQITFGALIKPWEINILHLAMLFTTMYTAPTYGLYYSFFESFPLVYRDICGFSLGQVGLAFLAVLVGLVVGVAVYCAYVYYVADPKMAKMESVPPEARLWPGLIASFLTPIGLFISVSQRPSIAGLYLSTHILSSLDSPKIDPLDCQSRWGFDQQYVLLPRSCFCYCIDLFGSVWSVHNLSAMYLGSIFFPI
jgi:DHA1 family multidrug resistance protein-like MFS transporter